MSVSRRGFFGALALPLAAKVTRPTPRMDVIGLGGWIPDDGPGSDPYFGVDRGDVRESLIAACNQLATMAVVPRYVIIREVEDYERLVRLAG